jgi:hypothetical protein
MMRSHRFDVVVRQDLELEPTFRRLVNKVNNIFGKRNPGKKEYVDVQGLS